MTDEPRQDLENEPSTDAVDGDVVETGRAPEPADEAIVILDPEVEELGSDDPMGASPEGAGEFPGRAGDPVSNQREGDSLFSAPSSVQPTVVLDMDPQSFPDDDEIGVTGRADGADLEMVLDGDSGVAEETDADTAADTASGDAASDGDVGGCDVAFGEDGEEVFVILPEQMGEDIPVVETEVFDDEEIVVDFGTNPETVLVEEVTPDLEETRETEDDDEKETEVPGSGDRGVEGPTGIVDGTELEQIAAELDDQVLAGSSAAGIDDFEDADVFSFDDDGVVSAPVPGVRRLVVPLLAAAVLGCGGFYLYNVFFAAVVTEAQAQGVTVAARVDTVPVVEDPVELPADGVESVEGTGVEVLDEELRTAFREGVTLAMNLGFQFEDSNE